MHCFKAYDIRGRVPEHLNVGMAYALGLGLACELGFGTVAIGHDARLSSPMLAQALGEGIAAGGARAASFGLCCTEEIYRIAARENFDAAVMITGSHNPADENGFKLLRRGAVPISRTCGLERLESYVQACPLTSWAPAAVERREMAPLRQGYVEWLLDYTRLNELPGRPLKVLAHCGNGAAGEMVRALLPKLPFEIVLAAGEPDGSFPNGVPNPLLPENREHASQAVRASRADFGAAWDGDADRCFFYDADGNFIDGYYMVGILARALLATHPGEKILHDPRAYWNTVDAVREAGGVPLMARTGHAFIKERMRAENALYGGEMSAHHYFRDFAFCDSGILPWLLVTSLVARSGQSLAEMARDAQEAFPISGELNLRLQSPEAALARAERKYAVNASHIDHLDGLNIEFPQWRFNLRMSNTEPLVRLNVEGRANPGLVADKAAEILEFLRAAD